MVQKPDFKFIPRDVVYFEKKNGISEGDLWEIKDVSVEFDLQTEQLDWFYEIKNEKLTDSIPIDKLETEGEYVGNLDDLENELADAFEGKEELAIRSFLDREYPESSIFSAL